MLLWIKRTCECWLFKSIYNIIYIWFLNSKNDIIFIKLWWLLNYIKFVLVELLFYLFKWYI